MKTLGESGRFLYGEINCYTIIHHIAMTVSKLAFTVQRLAMTVSEIVLRVPRHSPF